MAKLDSLEKQTISVIIPCHHDYAAVEILLKTIRAWPKQPLEIIVISSQTAIPKSLHKLCAQLTINLQSHQPNRGEQLAKGCQLASGDIFWLLHADCLPPDNSIAVITETCQSGAKGGFFKFKFSGKSNLIKKCLTWLINFRCQWGVPYGDQGIFITKTCYQSIGGFKPWPLFEEVPLVKATKLQGNFISLPDKIIVSSRRWEQQGWFKVTLKNRLLALAYLMGIGPEKLAKLYWQTSK